MSQSEGRTDSADAGQASSLDKDGETQGVSVVQPRVQALSDERNDFRFSSLLLERLVSSDPSRNAVDAILCALVPRLEEDGVIDNGFESDAGFDDVDHEAFAASSPSGAESQRTAASTPNAQDIIGPESEFRALNSEIYKRELADVSDAEWEQGRDPLYKHGLCRPGLRASLQNYTEDLVNDASLFAMQRVFTAHPTRYSRRSVTIRHADVLMALKYRPRVRFLTASGEAPAAESDPNGSVSEDMDNHPKTKRAKRGNVVSDESVAAGSQSQLEDEGTATERVLSGIEWHSDAETTQA